MRAAPVNLTARGTTPEFLVVDLRERLELPEHGRLFNRLEWRVATQAAAEWRQHASEIKTPQHFRCLFRRLLRAETVAVLHDRMHEQTPIPREQSPILDL